MDDLPILSKLTAMLDALPDSKTVTAPAPARTDDEIVAALDRWARSNGALPKSIRDATA